VKVVACWLPEQLLDALLEVLMWRLKYMGLKVGDRMEEGCEGLYAWYP